IVKTLDADQVLLSDVFWQRGFVFIILCSIEPRGKQHLLRSTPVPVTLFIVFTNLANTGSESLCHHCSKCRVVQRCNGHLPFSRRRATDYTYLSIRPRLFAHPFNCIIAIGERCSHNIPFTFGEESAAFILNHVGIATLYGINGGFKRTGTHFAIYPCVEIVWCSLKHNLYFGISFLSISVG